MFALNTTSASEADISEVCENGEAEVRVGNSHARPASFEPLTSFERASKDFLGGNFVEGVEVLDMSLTWG